MVFGPPFWASCCVGDRNTSFTVPGVPGTGFGSSRDEFREFPGRKSDSAGDISRQSLKTPIQTLSSAGWKTRLPRRV